MNIMDDKIKELKRDLINDIIESEKNPFEKELEVILEKILEIAKKLGFKTENIDGDVGYAEYGMGDEYIFVIAVLKNKHSIMSLLYALKTIEKYKIKLKRKIRIIFETNDESGIKNIKCYLKKDKSTIDIFESDCKYSVVYLEEEIDKFTIQNYLDITNIRIHQDIEIDKNIKYCCIEVPKEYIYEDIICYLENKANSEEGIISTYKNINIKINETHVIITSFMNSDIAKTGIYGNNVLINLVNYLVEENFIEHQRLSNYFLLINKYFYEKKELFASENSKKQLNLDNLNFEKGRITIELDVDNTVKNEMNYSSDESIIVDEIILNAKIFADIICELDKEEQC
ncbi:MAG: hypothetical protein ACRDC3_14310 [Paraclostridium dentum]|uniref:Uncharacterized protein n=3 Tax=Paraclostridium bifermentans TaxID=1490 RepID=A0A5P3XJH1_PARBF|nr:M20 family metallopeptidase [Paraclostridium bifermentans]QEZ70500.1 hypothetical protein D4A35_16935 [Paraclostridium bifermentans]